METILDDMTQEKTIKEWIGELPEPLREEAFDRMYADAVLRYASFKFLLIKNCDSLSEAIMSAFTWSESKSGQEFWESFYEALTWAENGGK